VLSRLCIVWAALLLAPASPARAGDWVRPVPGPVLTRFLPGPDPFARGLHRGVDLQASAGTPVLSGCAGRVVFAGTLPSGVRALSVRCGRRRATYLGLASGGPRAGASVARGARLGHVGPPRGRERRLGSHLHWGVRVEGARRVYVDPLTLLGDPARRPPLPAGRAPGRGPGRAAPPRPVRIPRARPVLAARPTGAPWPVWAALALVLAGAGVGPGRMLRRARTVRRHARPLPAARR